MSDTIQNLIRQYDIREAFWAAAEDIENDTLKRNLFLMILSFSNNVALLRSECGKIRELAGSGRNPYMVYACARLHDVLQPEEKSNIIKEQYYTFAANYGIGDAYAFLAYMSRDGDLGEQDMNAYADFMARALENGSGKAFQQKLRDLIYGSNGSAKDAQKAYELAEDCLRKLDFTDPAYYMLMADADMEMGRKDSAVCNYRMAAENGCSSAFYWWAVSECCDEDWKVEDRARFTEIMQKGIDVDAADSFVMNAMLLDDGIFDGLDEAGRRAVAENLLNGLEKGWMLGDSLCAFHLGSYYENGRYGFEQDYVRAWLWYSRGAVLRNPLCFAELARMILDDSTAPASYDGGYAYECAYRGLLLGEKDLLEVVVRGYKNGFLVQHAAMIESKWLPEYEKEAGEMMDDHDIDDDWYDDGHEYLYDGEAEQEIEED